MVGSKRKYLTKSIFKIGLECPRKLYYHKKPDEYYDDMVEDTFLQALADGGYQVGALAKLQYPEGKEVSTLDYDEAVRQTNELLKLEEVVIFEAAFQFDRYFVRSDIVVKKGNTLKVIEVKSKQIESSVFRDEVLSSRPQPPPGKIRLKSNWSPYIYDLAFQTWVARKATNLKNVTAYLMALDKTKLNPEAGLHSLFLISRKPKGCEIVLTKQPGPSFCGFEILAQVDLTDLINDIIDGKELSEHHFKGTLEEKASKLADIYLNNRQHPSSTVVSAGCKSCQFRGHANGLKSGFDECWVEAQNILAASSKPMVFDLWNNRSSHKQLSENVFLLKDIDPNSLTGETTRDRQALIIEKHRDGDKTPWFAINVLKSHFESWKYPFHFIDFETCRPAIPFQKGQHPYSQIAFQFSHHMMHKDGRIEHAGEFINLSPGVDPTFAFVRALKANLENDEGSIFIYSKHENSVLNDIARQLEDSVENDREELIAFIRSITRDSKTKQSGPRVMVDLLEVLKECYYSPLTGNSNSIKYVLPAILAESDYLRGKYSKPIYGTEDMPSLNFKEKRWLDGADNSGDPLNPYHELQPIFAADEVQYVERLLDEDQSEIKDGGAAMIAYCKTQFTQMSDRERSEIRAALLRYCELDTLAMVMLMEYWREECKNKSDPKKTGRKRTA